MRFKFSTILILYFIIFISSCNGDDKIQVDEFKLQEISIDGVTGENTFTDVKINPVIRLLFSDAPDPESIKDNIQLKDKNNRIIPLTVTYESEKDIQLTPVNSLSAFTSYDLIIYPGLTSRSNRKIWTGKTFAVETGMDLTDKFPRIPEDQLLDLVQQQTFNYFWDFGHPVSGMARERTTSGNTVTTGGTGFGVMAMVVAAERGFITREQALERIRKIVSFLDNQCETYHGAYAHWINGETGATLPFSEKDNGADLVETALLFQGLLTARSYFTGNSRDEIQLREDITRMWEAIEWTWFQKEGENVLYWHWSPEYEWDMNLKVTGWNEALIVYVLAASSSTYPIDPEVYHQGWARNGAFENGNRYYSITLPLGEPYGGPLFYSHYSFLGINPENLSDTYTNYWEQNRNHTLINYNYCKANPKGYRGYGEECWGLTASDGNTGYSAYSPENDKGVIAPTAALSSMPYTPQESMQALEFFYYKLGDKLWSDYGFYDAFNLTANWYDNQQLAIDQGPIVIMIENYRSGLAWSLFMADQDIKTGLTRLGFSSPAI